MPVFLFRPAVLVSSDKIHFHYAENDSRILSPLVSFAERCKCSCDADVEFQSRYTEKSVYIILILSYQYVYL